jgi:sulfite exporter TauE/SafE
VKPSRAFVFARFKSLQTTVYLKNNRELPMSMPVQIPNPYLEAISVGLLYGLVYCTPTCLPYLASYIAGVGAGFRNGTMATLVFNFGRITSYAVVGGLVGILGGVFRFVVTESSLAAFQQYSSFAFGVITILIGVAVYLKSRSA